MSTKGAIFFAYNNSELDYIKLAKLSATSIKQHLNLDCTLITDVDVNSDVFDNIIVEEIEYKQNRLVMFLNSPYSIHGVSKRSKTTYYRKYINIIGEFNFELFNYRNFF